MGTKALNNRSGATVYFSSGDQTLLEIPTESPTRNPTRLMSSSQGSLGRRRRERR